MGFDIMVDFLGSVDKRTDIAEESIYLMGADHRIIGMRCATHQTGPTPKTGDDFFQLFPASDQELRTLSGMTNVCNDQSLLMWAGDRPVVILCALFARTGLLAAIVPEAPVRDILGASAQYAELLQECHLFLSAESMRHKKELDEREHRLLYAWVQYVHNPFFYHRFHHLEPKAALLNAIARINRLTTLCGCSVTYDLTGIEHTADAQNDFDLLVGSVFSLLLTVHRVSADRHVDLTAGIVYGCGPMVGAIFSSSEPADALFELQHLAKEATLRGERFEIATHPEDPCRIMVQFALCHKELSEQGIKRPTPSCFFENRNDLPYAIPDAPQDVE